MPLSAEERIATNEQRLREMASDVQDLRGEERRTRDRLHKLEGSVALLLNAEDERHRHENIHLRRLALTVQVVAVAVAFVGLLQALVLAIVVTHH